MTGEKALRTTIKHLAAAKRMLELARQRVDDDQQKQCVDPEALRTSTDFTLHHASVTLENAANLLQTEVYLVREFLRELER